MSPSTPVKRKFGGSETVTLIVGAAKTKFSVHEDLLFELSPVFKAAFGTHFRESSDRTITLPDDDLEVFEYLIEWVYTGQVELLVSMKRGSYDIKEILTAVGLYILGEKYDIAKLRDDVCQKLSAVPTESLQLPPKAAIELVYDNTSTQCMLRKLLTDWYVWNPTFTALFEEDEFRTWLLGIPELHLDITGALAKVMGSCTRDGFSPFDVRSPCHYLEGMKPKRTLRVTRSASISP